MTSELRPAVEVLFDTLVKWDDCSDWDYITRYREAAAVIDADREAVRAPLLAEIERLREALKTAEAWLDRWARHIGECPGIEDCTCGLTRVRYEATTALKGDSHDQ